MFDCRACPAKDAEIARLVAERQDLLDRFLVLTGKLMEFQEAREIGRPEPSDDAPKEPELTEEDWQERELESKAVELATKGTAVRPDFA